MDLLGSSTLYKVMIVRIHCINITKTNMKEKMQCKTTNQETFHPN